MEVLTTAQLIDRADKMRITRRITEIHIHHTWKPEHRDFKGNNHIAMNKSMEAYHKGKGWSAIAQQLTLFPDGKWVMGRDFNTAPASITGRNAQGLCIEMVGNFDQGKDKFVAPQSAAIFEFCAFWCQRFGLDPDKAIIFHREFSPKTCPGTGIDKAWFVGEVKKRMEDEEVEPITVIKGNRIMQGFMKDGTAYAPARQLAETLGAKVEWDAKEKRVTVK